MISRSTDGTGSLFGEICSPGSTPVPSGPLVVSGCFLMSLSDKYLNNRFRWHLA